MLPELRHPVSTLTNLAQLPRGFEEIATLGKLDFAFWEGEGFAVVLREPRFVVEEVDVGRSAVHEEEDHALGTSGKLGRELRGADLFTEQGVEGKSAKAEPDAMERVAAGQGGTGAKIDHRR